MIGETVQHYQSFKCNKKSEVAKENSELSIYFQNLAY